MWKGFVKKGGDWRVGSNNKVDVWKIGRDRNELACDVMQCWALRDVNFKGRWNNWATVNFSRASLHRGFSFGRSLVIMLFLCVCVCVCVSTQNSLSSVSNMTTTLIASWVQNTKTCSLWKMRPSSSTEIAVFWHVTPCSLIEIFRLFGGSRCTHAPRIHLQFFLKTWVARWKNLTSPPSSAWRSKSCSILNTEVVCSSETSVNSIKQCSVIL